MAFVCLQTSCSKKGIVANCSQSVIINEVEFDTAPDDEVSITEIIIIDNCLNITFNASGCDGNTWIVKLIDSGNIAESLPPQRTLRLSLANTEDCEAIITKTLSFGITSLQVDTDEVILNIEDEEGFLYSY